MNLLEDLSQGLAWARKLASEGTEDSELPALSALIDPDGAKSWWARGGAEATGLAGFELNRCEALRYRPGRRCTLRFHLGGPDRRRIYVKLHRPSRARRIAACLEELASLGPWRELSVPPLLGFLPREGILLLGEVQGRSLEEEISVCLGKGPESAGRAIRRFHGLGAARPRAWSVEDELDVVARHLEGLRRAAGDDADRVDGLHARLVRAADRLRDSPPVLLHRDLHPHQVLLDGRCAGLVDLDDIARGPAEIDLGNLIAHIDLMGLHLKEDPCLHQKAVRGFLAGYAGGRPRPSASLASARALALFRLAGIQAGRPELGDLWLHLLDHAERVLGGGGPQ